MTLNDLTLYHKIKAKENVKASIFLQADVTAIKPFSFNFVVSLVTN
jgi:hypothetical protein